MNIYFKKVDQRIKLSYINSMKVIFDKNSIEEIGNRLTLLELDTFFQPGLNEPVTAYAVIDNESVPIQEFPTLETMVELHNTMMLEYRKRNWAYVEQAIEHLYGKWSKNLDSFYDEMSGRIAKLKKTNLPDDWTGIVINTFT
jgi:hypothetical protein